ncbi:MAG TPA: ABC transporter permease [Candidatus Woesebacteria bacterium]|nr:ABC transporter permease [Candidatus Woesebacteria bacterium]
MKNHYLSLVTKLTLKEIKARYKQSFFGFLWIIFNPFFQMLIMSFVFSQIIRFGNFGVPYAIFIYAGLLPWTFFSLSLTSSTGILIDNASLLKKIYFPREVFVLSTLLAKAFDFVLASLVFFLLMIYFKVPFTFYILFAIPIFLIQFLFTFSLGLLLSSLNLFYRDIQYIFNLLLSLWFYVTPVIYATEFFPEKYRWIFAYNPMSVFINAYRQVLLGGSAPNWESLGIGTGISILFFFFSFYIFKTLEKVFADVV